MADKETPIINDFRAGEMSPGLDARSDLEAYYKGCRVLLNSIPISEGGAIRVPGTYYVQPIGETQRFITEDGNHLVAENGDHFIPEPG